MAGCGTVIMCYHKSVCLVVLVGIPSSGKTFFRTYLENFFIGKVDSMIGSVLMCTVSYDKYEKVKSPQCFLTETRWKEERLEIFNVVKNILLHYLNNTDEIASKCVNNVTIVNGTVNKPDNILILIDDNMYYRSMRYEYYKLARENNISFCQFYFNIELEKALKSNKQRNSESRVPDFIIKSMFDKLEPPLVNHSWEKNSMNIMCYADFENEIVTDNIFTFLRNVLLNPIQPNYTKTSSVKDIARQITNSSAFHQIDNALKQIVGDIIKQAINDNNSKSQEISKTYSNKRLNLLRQIKNGIVLLPIDVTKPIDEKDMYLIKPVLFSLLRDIV